jgi:hypothetical protein
MRFLGALCVAALLLSSNGAVAGAEFLNYKSYIELAGQLAPKVDLFKDIWQQDPDAGIYAGTSRDFLYWILKQFQHATTAESATKIRRELLARDKIEVREFVMRESDVDVISWRFLKIDAAAYRVHKVDMINASRLDPNSVYGRTEIDQGFIPAEKIVIGKNGIREYPQFGDGAREIFEGHLTVHFTPWEIFKETHYARLMANHPILLALRYLRLLAVDEYNRFGRGFSFREVSDLMDSHTEAQIREIIDKALDGKELLPYLQNDSFTRWLNSTIRRAYRSYSNVNVANKLMLHFRVNELSSRYPAVKFTNNYLFARSWDWGEIEKNMEKYQVDESEFLSPIETTLPGLKGYHGAGTDYAFDNIIMQGILPSVGGTAGQGTYMVGKSNIDFAIHWRGGGRQRLVELTFAPTARLVDIRGGEGSRVYNAFSRQHYGADTLEAFVEAFGIDIICYPYTPTAYVIKNSEVIVGINGAYRTVLTFGKARERAETLTTSKELRQLLTELNGSDIAVNDMKSIVQSVKQKFPISEIVSILKAVPVAMMPLIFELTTSPKDFIDLIEISRRRLSDDRFIEILDRLDPTHFSREKIDDDHLIQLIQSFDRDAEVARLIPYMLQRIDAPEIATVLETYLKNNHRRHAGALLGLALTFTANSILPWRNSALLENNGARIDVLPPLSQMILSLLFLQANYDYERSLQRLTTAFASLEFTKNRNELRSVQSSVAHDAITFTALKPAEVVSMLEVFRAGLKFITLVAPEQSFQGTEKALSIWSSLKISDKESLEILTNFNMAFMQSAPDKDQIRVTRLYLDAVISGTWPDLPVALRMKIMDLAQRCPEAIYQLAEDPALERMMTFQQLILLPVKHPEELAVHLKEAKTEGVQALFALKMAEANMNTEFAAQTFSQIFSHVKVTKTFEVRLNSGYVLSQNDFTLMYARFLSALTRLPSISSKLFKTIVGLPEVPTELKDLPINIEIEALKWSLVLEHSGRSPRTTIRTIRRAILDPKKSDIQRMSAARAMALFDKSGKGQADAAKKLKSQFQKIDRRWFWQRHLNVEAFFNHDNHKYLNLFRHLGVEDSAMSDFLYNSFVKPGPDSLSAAQAAAFLLDLNIREKRFEAPLVKLLSKTAAKNMELYFKSLVTLFPSSTASILESLYVGHFVGELFTKYLDILVIAAAEDSTFLDALTDARLRGTIPKRRQLVIEGLYLDDWIRHQIESRGLGPCEKALLPATEVQ